MACTREKESERQTDRQTDRERERDRQRERESESERERDESIFFRYYDYLIWTKFYVQNDL